MVLEFLINKRKSNEIKSSIKIISDFCQMTGGSQTQAENFLSRTNYNFQNAINLFFDEGTVPEIKKL